MDFLDEAILSIREKIDKLQKEVKSDKRVEQSNLFAQIKVLKADLDKLRQDSSVKIDAKKAERDAVIDSIIDKLGLKLNISVLARPVAVFDENNNNIKYMEGEIVTTTSIKDSFGNRVFAREVTREVPERKIFEMDLRESRRMEKRLLAKTDIHDYIVKFMRRDDSLSWIVEKFYPNAQRGKLAKVIKELEEDYAGESRESLELKYIEIRQKREAYPRQLEKQRSILKKLERKSERNEKAKAMFEKQLSLFRNLEDEMASAKKEEKRIFAGIELFGKKGRLEKQIKAMDELLSTPELKNLISQFETKQHELESVIQENKPATESADAIEKKIKMLRQKSDELSKEIDEEEYALGMKTQKEIDKLIPQEVKKLVEGEFGKNHSATEVREAVDDKFAKIDNIDAKIINELLDQMDYVQENESGLE